MREALSQALSRHILFSKFNHEVIRLEDGVCSIRLEEVATADVVMDGPLCLAAMDMVAGFATVSTGARILKAFSTEIYVSIFRRLEGGVLEIEATSLWTGRTKAVVDLAGYVRRQGERRLAAKAQVAQFINLDKTIK